MFHAIAATALFASPAYAIRRVLDFGRNPAYKRELCRFVRCASESWHDAIADRRIRCERYERKAKTWGKQSRFAIA